MSSDTLSKYLLEVEIHIKNAQEQTLSAENAERSGKVEDAAKQYFLAGREHFLQL